MAIHLLGSPQDYNNLDLPMTDNFIFSLMSDNLENLKFPIGAFKAQNSYSLTEISHFIDVIATFPMRLRKEVANFTLEQLATPYRPDGWTVAQTIHHLADSHANSFIRFKLALTEDKPTIKPYEEQLWAKLADSKPEDIELSLAILDNLHKRWVLILVAMTEKDWFERGFVHPAKQRLILLSEAAATYAWHCEHHLAHITKLKEKMQW